jgi:uncharacterized protein
VAEPLPPQIIQGYGNGLFRIAGVEHRGSVIVFADRTLPWAGEVSEAGLAAVMAAEATLDLLLVGCGATMRPVPGDLRATLRKVGIAVEPMDTGAACRTFNVLLAEERRVAAALIAIG